jgi:hypothetical protein
MFLSLILSYFKRSSTYAWSPALDLKDHVVLSTLIPGTQY